ncbi:MAG: helix-turn-helix domain-containing protein, partial [Prevotellaceae bacterium]|nr:helix-turn-helix domain-containing protein [Prevotellaceae bacterium]
QNNDADDEIVNQARELALRVSYYYSQFDNDSIFIVGKEAEDFTRKHKQYQFLFIIQQTIIQRYIDENKLIVALRKAEDAMHEAKDIDDDKAMARMLSSLAYIYTEMRQYEQSVKYYKESIYKAKKSSNPGFLPVENYMHIVADLVSLGDKNDEAIVYIDTMRIELDDYQKANPDDELTTYYYILEFYTVMAFAEKQPEVAHTHLLKMNAMFQSEWGEFYAYLLDNAHEKYYHETKNYTEALAYNRKIISLFEGNQLSFGFLAAMETEASILENTGRYKEAAAEYKRVLMSRDSLNNEQFFSQINELRTLYELDKIETQAEKSRLSLRISQTVAVALTGACLLLAVIIWLVMRSKRRLKSKNRGLVQQIKEQDRLAVELEKERARTKELQLFLKTDNDITYNEEENLFNLLNELMKSNNIYVNTEITRKEISNMLNTNEKYITNAIKQHTGMTFTDYISEFRLNYARNLFLENKHTIESIAFMSGFGSRRNFQRLFSKRYGLSPDSYKKLLYQESN